MVNEAKEIFVVSSTGQRYKLVGLEDNVKLKKQRKKRHKIFKAYGSLYQEEGDKILLLVQECIRISNAKWASSDVVRGILTEYLKLLDLEKMSSDLIKGCYNQ